MFYASVAKIYYGDTTVKTAVHLSHKSYQQSVSLLYEVCTCAIMINKLLEHFTQDESQTIAFIILQYANCYIIEKQINKLFNSITNYLEIILLLCES